jgi:hypothetical protein
MGLQAHEHRPAMNVALASGFSSCVDPLCCSHPREIVLGRGVRLWHSSGVIRTLRGECRWSIKRV